MIQNQGDNNALQDPFLTGLQSWVDESPEYERDSRIEAMNKIIEAKNGRATRLSLAFLNLSTLPSQIANLSALRELHLNNNRLETVPESLFERRDQSFLINLSGNLVSPNEAQRLFLLAQNAEIILNISHDRQQTSATELPLIDNNRFQTISNSSFNERRQAIANFRNQRSGSSLSSNYYQEPNESQITSDSSFGEVRQAIANFQATANLHQNQRPLRDRGSDSRPVRPYQELSGAESSSNNNRFQASSSVNERPTVRALIDFYNNEAFRNREPVLSNDRFRTISNSSFNERRQAIDNLHQSRIPRRPEPELPSSNNRRFLGFINSSISSISRGLQSFPRRVQSLFSNRRLTSTSSNQNHPEELFTELPSSENRSQAISNSLSEQTQQRSRSSINSNNNPISQSQSLASRPTNSSNPLSLVTGYYSGDNGIQNGLNSFMEMQELNSEIRRLEGLQQTATIRMEMAQQRVFYDNQTTQNRSLISSSLNNYFRPFSNSEYRESIESRESDPSEPDTYTEYLDSSDRRIQSLSQNQISTSSSSNAGHRESSATGIIGKIIAKAPAGKRKELQDFLQSENLSDFFKEFLSECPRTRGWKNKEALMTQGLLNIVDQMSQNQALKTKCEILAETALGSCEDRVTLAFLQMQLAINLSGKELQNMSISEVYDYAKQESLMNFLTNKAEAKILQIEDFKRGIGEAEASRIIKDEIEIYLAYLQIGQELGLKMQASDMLYQACSHVSNEELQSAKQEFLAADQNQRIASHIYNDDYLKQHVFVKSIIEEVGNRAEFNADSEQSENDLDAVYLNRIKNLQQSFITTVISEISSEIEKAFVSPGHSVISPRASSTNQASNKSQQNS